MMGGSLEVKIRGRELKPKVKECQKWGGKARRASNKDKPNSQQRTKNIRDETTRDEEEESGEEKNDEWRGVSGGDGTGGGLWMLKG